MCFFDQHLFDCGDWKWGRFREHCAVGRGYQVGETCGMKLAMQTILVEQSCKVCEEIGVKLRRRGAEAGRLEQWLCAGDRFRFTTSLDASMRTIASLDSEIYELQRSRTPAWQRIRRATSPPRPCNAPDCFLPGGHALPHQSWSPCGISGCHLQAGHSRPHAERLPVTSRTVATRLEKTRNEEREKLQMLNRLVLRDMDNPRWPSMEAGIMAAPADRHPSTTPIPIPKKCVLDPSANPAMSRPPYLDLNFSSQQIRLFELKPITEGTDIQGSFRYVELTACPAYIALSYAWGDTTDTQQITVGGDGTVDVRKNLWEFLRQQSSTITEPKLFWIDAICINQPNVHERNHQVKLMKEIYTNASDVYVWLGREADNSDLAMDYILKKGARKLRPRGSGFYDIWTREEGRALSHLCERPYWERMWIVQEIVHAEKITVWCGAKSFDWSVLENLYLTLKTLDDTHWIMHHRFANEVFHSPAAVMVWQRAHWRHPQTPTPSLQTLIEVFHKWKCTDVRDKVFALVSMASPDTAIIPDYSWSVRQVYATVQARPQFNNLLSQVLTLSSRDLVSPGQDLTEYKSQPPQWLVLRMRVE